MTETDNSSGDLQKYFEAAQNIAKRNLEIQQHGYRISVDALTPDKLGRERIKQVVKAVLEGFRSGFVQNSAHLETTYRKAVNGMDEALASAAIATKFQIEEAGSKAGEYTDHEIQRPSEISG